MGTAITNLTQNLEVAILAGGCFWGVEELFRAFPGVVSTEVGYTGGPDDQPELAVYEHVKKGNTGHAESIKITFSPQKITYGQILDYFFTLHDPTTKNQQGNDIGSQYRSAIFYTSLEQKNEASSAVMRAQNTGLWKNKIITEITQAKTFFSAEAYHQKYLIKNPGGYTCHYIRK